MTIKHFEFTNDYGERWQLEIDVDLRIGTLTGDELGDGEVLIADDEILSDLILGEDERLWLNRVWTELFGRRVTSAVDVLNKLFSVVA